MRNYVFSRRRSTSFSTFNRIPAHQPLVNGYLVTLDAPYNGAMVRDTSPNIYFTPQAELGLLVDVQVEWRLISPTEDPEDPLSWVPEPTYFQEIVGLVSGSPSFVEPPVPLSRRAWYYRVRAGSKNANTWGSWTDPARYVNVQEPSGSITEYIDLNVGVNKSLVGSISQYLEMNIGVKEVSAEIVSYVEMNVGLLQSDPKTAAYIELNVGAFIRKLSTATYLEMNIDTSQPDPVIWWIRPEEGKEGYVFNIFGHGFGNFQGEYGGKVRLGNLVCEISRWERVPAALRSGTVIVSGKPRAVASTTTLPYVLLSTEQRIVQAGDIIEFDLQWDYPLGSRLDVFPYFSVSGSSNPIGYGSAQLSDTTGKPWISELPGAQGAWHHRRFIVPAGSYLVGRNITNFGIGWYGSAADTPTRTAQVRSFVVRQADETPLIWVTGDDAASSPALTYIANTGVLDFAEFDQAGHIIQRGQALDPDEITPEHGWIVAVVPPGAVSSMVRVSLEE